MQDLPSREYLLECFDYDKETDTLTWRKRPAEHFDSASNYKMFKTSHAGKEIKSRGATINGVKFSKSKIVFKIVNGNNPPRLTTQVGTYQKHRSGFIASFTADNKRYSKLFKFEIEAQEWLKEMRIKFEKNELPVNNRKPTICMFYGVSNGKNGKYRATIWFKKEKYNLGSSFKTAKEASDAYQLAKQQIKDGVFVPPKKLISNSGIRGVHEVNGKFVSSCNSKYIGTFDTAEEAHAAYLKAKNHKTFDDGLDILQKLAQQYG
jgi:hypothetical protein